MGFKRAKKMTAAAALALMDAVVKDLEERKVDTVRLDFRGMNYVRQVIYSQLRMSGLAITEMMDSTPMKGMGPRPKKARRW